MSLYNTKKLEHLKKAKGKYVGASMKESNYTYGREKARKIASSGSPNVNRLKKIALNKAKEKHEKSS